MRVAQLCIDTWHDLCEFATNVDGFMFRGQADADWPLESSLERAYRKYSPIASHFEYGEKWALHEFKQKYHLYSGSVPIDSDYFEWLALLQHHGFPTRLLDFTWSIYTACFFAVANATTDSAIWCISHWGIRDHLLETFSLPYKKGYTLKDEVNQLHKELINKCIGVLDPQDKASHLVPLESTRHSQRLSRQQGLFLAPTTFGSFRSRITFEDSLRASFPAEESSIDISMWEFMNTGSPATKFSQLKVVLPQSLYHVAHRQLAAMGVTDESLFPDLDGLARSLVLKHIRH